MRDEKRIPIILGKLEVLWNQYPDYRLGQLIGNVIENVGLYYIEDEDLIELLTQTYNEWRKEE